MSVIQRLFKWFSPQSHFPEEALIKHMNDEFTIPSNYKNVKNIDFYHNNSVQTEPPKVEKCDIATQTDPIPRLILTPITQPTTSSCIKSNPSKLPKISLNISLDDDKYKVKDVKYDYEFCKNIPSMKNETPPEISANYPKPTFVFKSSNGKNSISSLVSKSCIEIQSLKLESQEDHENQQPQIFCQSEPQNIDKNAPSKDNEFHFSWISPPAEVSTAYFVFKPHFNPV